MSDPSSFNGSTTVKFDPLLTVSVQFSLASKKPFAAAWLNSSVTGPEKLIVYSTNSPLANAPGPKPNPSEPLASPTGRPPSVLLDAVTVASKVVETLLETGTPVTLGEPELIPEKSSGMKTWSNS